MRVDRQEIVDVLDDRGQHVVADWARAHLPHQLDTRRDRDDLARVGVEPEELSGGLDDDPADSLPS